MKVTAVQLAGPRHIEIIEETLPEPGDGQVELRSICSGISHGTEMNVYRGVAPMWHMARDHDTGVFVPAETPQWQYPMLYGYACVAEVVRTGPNVSLVQKGDLVYTYSPHRSGHVVSEHAVMKLPAGMDPELGVLTANLNTTFNGVLDADIHLGETVVVFGQGVVGQLTAQWAKLSGAGQVITIDLVDMRLKVSKEVSGADVTLNPREVADIGMTVHNLTDKRGADVVFELSASDRALNEAIRTVCYNGKVIVMSWYADALPNVYLGREFHHNRVQLICSQTGGIRPELSNRWNMARRHQTVFDLMPKLNLKPLISDRMDHRDAATAYDLIDHHSDEIMQVILTY